jgi:hypothetical protein
MDNFELTLDDEFRLRKFADTIRLMTHNQLIDFTIELQKCFIVETKVRNELLAHQWGIDTNKAPRTDEVP